MNFAGKLVAQENLILKVSRVDLQLVSILVYQLEEKIKLKRDNETELIMRFNVENKL